MFDCHSFTVNHSALADIKNMSQLIGLGASGHVSDPDDNNDWSWESH